MSRRSLTGGVKNLRFEGSSASKLARLIQDIGENSEARIRRGKVTSINPLQVELSGSKFVLEADDMSIPDYLREHTRQVDISGIEGTRTMTVHSPLQVGQTLAMVEYPTTYGFEVQLIGIIR